MPDVLAYLEAKSLYLKRADSRNVHTACLFCDEPPDRRGRLYICVDPDAEIPGLYFCHRCGAKGSLTSLKRHFGDDVNENEADYQTRSEILNAAAAFYAGELGGFIEVLRYLKGPQRGLTVQTIKAHQIGYAPMYFDQSVGDATIVRRPRSLYRYLRNEGFVPRDILATGLCVKDGDTILDSLYGMVTIPYHVAGNVVAIRGRTWPQSDEDFAQWEGEIYDPPKMKYKTLGGTGARLFNTDAAWDTNEIIITEGEFDALVLEQEGFRAMGVPGAKSWQDPWDDYLKPLRRVWLIFDRDATGEAAAKTFVERHGSKVRRLHLSEEGHKTDPTEWFAQGHGADELRALMDEANKGGLLIGVRDAIDEFSRVQALPGIKFGWRILDAVIAPGLQPAQLMMLLAKTGTGKTLFLLNLMHRIKAVPEQADITILFISLEQTRGEWWDRARRIHRFYNLESTEEEAARFWEHNLLLVDRNRLSETDVRQAIEDFAYQMGDVPDLICLDYLGYWARSFRGEAYQRTSDAVMALKAIGKDYRVPIICPQQVSRVGKDGEEFAADAARDSGVIEETADFLLAMWTPDNALGRDEAERTGHIHLRLAKSRHGGRGQLFTMQGAPISLTMVPEQDEALCAAARQEWYWKREYGDDWARAVYRHVTGCVGKLSVDQEGRIREDRSAGAHWWQP